jgi:SPP1 gp7 family putative phage head morphogenesis protein
MPGDIFEVADRFKRRLIAREKATVREIRDYYREVERRIAKRLEALIAEIEQWQREHPDEEAPPAWWLFERERLQVLQKQIEAELARFSERATARLEEEQRRLVARAEADAEALARAGLGKPPPGVTVTWARLPTEALEQLVGTLQDGSPLRGLLDALGPAASETIRHELVSGLALGLNPRDVARRCRDALNGNRRRAETIARTEMLRAYREARRQSYLANDDVVEGWIWYSARDSRTCPMCWAMHGTVHRSDEVLDDHPNGRCTDLPLTKTWRELGFEGVPETRAKVEAGESLFARLPEEQQRAILGNAAFEAYRAGALKLSDFVGRQSDPRWGTMRYTRSLREILGASEARSWRQLSTSLRALGADVNRLAALREARLSQLRAMSNDQLEALFAEIRGATTLPKLKYHYQRHRELLGASNQDEYLALFREHIRRTDLRIATALRPKDHAPMWYLVAVDSGTIAQYNERERRFWSFFRTRNLARYLEDASVWWVEAIKEGDTWSFEPWKR